MSDQDLTALDYKNVLIKGAKFICVQTITIY